MFRTLIIFLDLCLCPLASAHEVLSPTIRTLQVVAGDDWLHLPVIDLGGEEAVTVSFDYMGHDHRRYTYAVEHCEADWTPSEGLFESDYLDGFRDGLTIDDDAQSLNTATLYTHYRLTIPNADCRIKLSGNYRLTVFDEDATPVLRARFMVVERRMTVGLDMTTDTDIDTRNSHQQLSVVLNYNTVSVTDPSRQITAFVLQNNRPSMLRRLPSATMTRRDGLAWQHCRDLIFPATNEYRKFECLDIHRSSMGVDRVTFDGDTYHAWLVGDRPRPHYVYDEDANGAFYIRNSDNRANDTETEYVDVHFVYSIPKPFSGTVYINGLWTNDILAPEYRMDYDPELREYRLSVPLKMGYYSYQYLLRHNDGQVEYLPSEGNYHETENQYACLVYYRPIGGRTDLLYGIAEIRP